MKLAKILRESGYDYIDSLFRNHKPLQLWLKKDGEVVDFYTDDFRNQLISEIIVDEVEIPSLDVDFTQTMEYKFNLGLNAIDKLLAKLGLENLSLDLLIEKGKMISISYQDSTCKGYERLSLENYLHDADIKEASNKIFIKNLNNNDVLLISSVLYAKKLKIEITSNSNLSLEIEAKVKSIVESKIEVSLEGVNKLILTSKNDTLLPIALKAYRLDYDNSSFSKMRLLTDHRVFF